MLELSVDDLKVQTNNFYNEFINGARSTIFEEDFIKNVFPKLQTASNRKYPYDVKIPKSMPEMLEGDFEPQAIIHVDKPIECEWGPMWFGDATKEIALRYGYINGDSREWSKFAIGDSTTSKVHGIMAGTTGSGKSVALNTVIYGACLEYAPWELKLVLSDAKITEFKALAMNNPMPQIKAVAATGDSDYLISIVEYYYNEMMMVNKVLTKAGDVFGKDIKGIPDFRKYTGLTLPRTLLVFDEFQTMFANAGRNLSKLIKLIDLYARLGRNSGYHLYLTSQAIDSNIPKDTLNNIGLRCALGCTAAVSEQIIGNDAAKKNNGQKGKLIVNLNPDDHNPEQNTNIVVPFCSPDNVTSLAKFIIDKGKEFKWNNVMNFYDESAAIKQRDHKKYIQSFPNRDKRIILGEISQMDENPEHLVDLTYKLRSNENILVLAPIMKNQLRHYYALVDNFVGKAGSHLAICGDPEYEEADVKDFFGDSYWDDATVNSDFFDIANYTVNKRSICLQADKSIFTGGNEQTSEETDKLFYSIVEKGSEQDTNLNRIRCFNICALVNTEKYSKAFSNSEDELKDLVDNCLFDYHKFGCDSKQLLVEKMEPIYCWILGLQKINGLGRDCKGKNVENLKQLLQDCSQVGVRFIIFTSNVEDTYELRNGVKWVIMDRPAISDISRIKVSDFYPNLDSEVLAVLFDLDDKEHPKKFKRMLFDDETL